MSSEVVRVTTLTKEISGAEVHLQDVYAFIVRGHEVRLEGATVLGPVTAEGNFSLRAGGCGPVRAGGDVSIQQGGCGPVRTDGNVSIHEGGCGPVLAGQLTVGANGVAGLVFADEVTVEPGGVIQRQLPASAPRWIGVGAAAGGLIGLVLGTLMARRSR